MSLEGQGIYNNNNNKNNNNNNIYNLIYKKNICKYSMGYI